MQVPATFEDLLVDANRTGLYNKLIRQLNKDFRLANIDLDFSEDILPTSLSLTLHETLYTLIQENFSDYLNLLYIIDVPEEKVKSLDGNDILKLSRQVAFLILLREWKKVWYRNEHKD